MLLPAQRKLVLYPTTHRWVANGVIFRVWAPGAEKSRLSVTSTHGPRMTRGC